MAGFVSPVGPGQYDVKEGGGRGGLMTTRQQRFKSLKSETPGPGSYEVRKQKVVNNYKEQCHLFLLSF